jgi:hypothetical protein
MYLPQYINMSSLSDSSAPMSNLQILYISMRKIIRVHAGCLSHANEKCQVWLIKTDKVLRYMEVCILDVDL